MATFTVLLLAVCYYYKCASSKGLRSAKPVNVASAVSTTSAVSATSTVVAAPTDVNLVVSSKPGTHLEQRTVTFAQGSLGVTLGDSADGVVFAEVSHGTQAATMGIPVGATILEVESKPVTTLKKPEVLALIKSMPRPLTMRIGIPSQSPKLSSTAGRARVGPSEQDKVLTQKHEKMLRDRLKLLKDTDSKTHIISCPYKQPLGVKKAKEISMRYEKDDREFCYYPNEDCPQTLNVSWLETWQAIAKNAKRTGGTVYVIYRTDDKGQYVCDAWAGIADLPGLKSLDGQAQPGEIQYALEQGCAIEWVGYGNEE